MQRWKLSALAAATLALSSLSATDAWALALGRITVQSALGEPLRAEVEIPQLSAAEADSLQAAIASPAAFRAQGMEYTGTANSVRVQVQKRANGSTILKLSSFQPVNDPFVDLVIDANWASGKLQRNYTLLLDPPSSRRAAPAPTTAAQAAPAPTPAVTPARPAATTRPTIAAINAPGRDLRNDRDLDTASSKSQRTRQAPDSAAAPARSLGEMRVKTGDTAGRIAAAHKPAGVSLDQMLVAMLRSNPQAFIGGNVNRMRSGAVIQLPDQTAAQATSAKEARKIMAAQSQDFNQFRRQLAGVAPVAPVEAASRSASGQVQAHVEDGKPSTAAPDKLTLSKGAVKGVVADEQLAQQKQAAEQSARADELKRNMAELSQIAAAAKPAGDAATPAVPAATPPSAPGINVPAATTATAAVPATGAEATTMPAAPTEAVSEPGAVSTDLGKPKAATEPAGETAPAPEPVEPPAPAPAPVAPPKPAAPPAPVPEEPSFIDSLMEDPTIPLAGAALLALLLGYGGYRVAQRRKAAAAAQADSTLGDSQLSADSFFGASGGQRVDTTTTSSQMSGQSMQYSPSQLDAGDVDPLAEADVYLAYGRDLQAEEILKEALRTDPNRLVLHQKLAEIYAKRHDRMAYAAVAGNLYALTQGKGPEWQRLADQGRILDPENQLYQPGGSPQAKSAAASSAFSPTDPSTALKGGAGSAVAFGSALAAAQANETAVNREGPPTEPSSMDFSLDLGLPEASANAKPVTSEPVAQPSEQDFAALAQWEAPAAAPAKPASDAAADNGLSLDLDDLASFSLPATASQAPTPVAAPAPAEQASLNALEFDLDSFALPLQPQSAQESTQDAASLNFTATGADEHSTEAMTLQLPIDEHERNISALTPEQAQPEAVFDLSGLSLDLGNSGTAPQIDAVAPPTEPEDPLATKLALAEEFNAIGDSDGARTLIEEVIAEAHGDLKAKAQSLLSQIG